MNRKERDILVKTWIEHNKKTRINGETAKESFWAWEKLNQATRVNPDLAWELMLQILETDQSDITFENLAAGHLEDLLVYHGKEFIDRVEKQANDDVNFNELLGGVWSNTIDSNVLHRIEKIRKSVW